MPVFIGLVALLTGGNHLKELRNTSFSVKDLESDSDSLISVHSILDTARYDEHPFAGLSRPQQSPQ